MLLVLGRVRLSRDTDASTSVARQREHIQRWADDNNAEIVGWAEDVDVSGKVDVFATPDLGPWLRPPLMNKWNVMVAWKLDRVSRAGVRAVNKLIEWMEENGKSLVTTEDKIDTRTSNVVTEIMLTVTASFAKEEREAISTRQIDSQKKLREVGRFRGGPIPFGYRTVKRDNAWYLEIDEDRAEIFRDMVEKYLGGMSLGGVAAMMNERAVPMPQKRRAGPGKWRAGTVIQMFKSRTCLGETIYKGRVVRDAEGRAIMRAKGLIDEPTFDRLQERLANARKQPVGAWTGTKKLLLDIIFCGVCGRKMYFTKGSGPRNYWRCSGATHNVPGEPKCEGRNIPARLIEDVVIGYVTFTVGARQQTEERFCPAEGVGAELKEVEEAIAAIRAEKYAGFYNNDMDTYMATLGAMIATRDELKAMPNKPARYETVATGGTWAEAMASAETSQDKRAILLKMGMRVDAIRDETDSINYQITTNLTELRATIPDALSDPAESEFVHGTSRSTPVRFTATA